MKIIQTGIIRLCLVLFIIVNSPIFSKPETLMVTFPVIPPVSAFSPGTLDGGSLKLKVNGIPRKITGFQRIERSLNNHGEHGRHFILSFITGTACRNLEKGLSYIISDLLIESDSLIVISPVKAYRIKIDSNKLKIIENILNLLKKDCSVYKKKKIAFEKSLQRELKKFDSLLSEKRGFFSNSRKSKIIFRFLNSFPQEFKRYLEMTFVPGMEKLGGAANLFGGINGEKWWIHFNSEEISGIIARVKTISNRLESLNPNFAFGDANYLRNNPALNTTAMSSSFSETGDVNYKIKISKLIGKLKKILKFSEANMNSEFIEKIQRSGICFNSIVFSSEDSYSGDPSSGNKSLSNKVLSRISAFSGGRSFLTNDIERAVKSIKDRKVTYYHLNFPLLRTDKSLKIGLENKGGGLTGFSYPKTLDGNYIKRVRNNFSNRSRLISNFSVNNNVINFKINGFKRRKEANLGLLKVDIRVTDQSGYNVYKKENILRVPHKKKDIYLSIRLAEKIKGALEIKLFVTDLVASNTSSRHENIYIK
ncbi:MAG: hypothetical protein KAS21_03940 [Candidatus Aminicenantes bacterium]|nr:hypothetical protein [Candidatus Aminicenantes bacterium]